MQLGARDWARHNKVRLRLAECVEEMEREERIKKMRDVWRAQVGKKSLGRRESGEKC
jgi:hypothetical protein